MDLNKLMQQAQEMQAGLQAAQQSLADTQVEAEGANGQVKAVATASGDLVSLTIDPAIIDPADAEFLTELITTTVQSAIQKGRDHAAEEMKKHTGGLGIPGL